MKHNQWFVQSKADYKIFVQQWLPDDGEVKAVVCLLHGSGEHSGRYDHVVEVLIAAHIVVIAYDHYGHGQSEGKRGDMLSIAACLTDVADICEYASQQFLDKPLYLYGHSMGGNIALNAALRQSLPISGLILTSPWLRLAFSPSPFKVWLGKKLVNIVPTLQQSTGLKNEDLNRPGFRPVRTNNDPLLHTRVTVRAFVALEEAGAWALQHGDELKVPLLLLHGDADNITAYEASVELKKTVGANCRFITFHGGYHELHNDLEGEKMLREVVDWISLD
ncbi:alpha/beta hydrolase [Paenibacillus yanchengensis]|uniref:Alpha/beta hydrolase n=1 Tax=Paenibacillus yanchengensis TaxID=2035833 RepID=A0ABW4YI83_9BACL